MGKYKPIKIKEVHTTYSKEDQQNSIDRIRELLAEAFIEYHNNNKHKPSI